jgi:glycosyltransferase involved in cell wall biosynthesis
MSEASDATLRLSGLVVAHDEEENLADCLGGLGFCNEVVVVLDRCSDGSKAIAERFTERILEGAWPIEGARRNAGIAACGGEWILEVDADERVGPELAAEIRRTVETSACAYHRIPVDNYVGRRLVRHGWGAQFGVSSAPRLSRRGVKRWGEQRVHPKLRFAEGAREGPRLENRLVHYLDRDISGMIRRLDRYTSARARDLRESGDIGSAFHNYRRIVSRFWKCFVTRRGYREGGLGFLIALCAGLYPILSYLKARYEDE